MMARFLTSNLLHQKFRKNFLLHWGLRSAVRSQRCFTTRGLLRYPVICSLSDPGLSCPWVQVETTREYHSPRNIQENCHHVTNQSLSLVVYCLWSFYEERNQLKKPKFATLLMSNLSSSNPNHDFQASEAMSGEKTKQLGAAGFICTVSLQREIFAWQMSPTLHTGFSGVQTGLDIIFVNEE